MKENFSEQQYENEEIPPVKSNIVEKILPVAVESNVEKKRPKPEVELNAELQNELIRKSITQGEDLVDHFFDWIEQLADKFSPIFDHLLIERPDIVKEWPTYSDSQKEALLSELEHALPAFVPREQETERREAA